MEYSRKKSCNQCRSAKTRCTLDLPNCSRCTKRNLPCQYEHPPSRPSFASSMPASPFHSWLAGTASIPIATGNNFGQHDLFVPTGLNHVPEPLDLQLPLGPILDAMHGRPGAIDWSADRPTISVARNRSLDVPNSDAENPMQSFNGPASDSDEVIYWIRSPGRDDDDSSTRQAVPLTTSDEDAFMTEVSSVMQRSIFKLSPWETLKRVPNKMQNILNRRPATKMSELIAGNFLQSKFESYAIDFDEGKLPPFIHQSCIMKDVGSLEARFDHLPKPLANCKSILPMYLHKTQSCKGIIVKTLMMEVQRIHDEYHGYDQETLIYCLQALVLYLILLARDVERLDLTSIVTRITIAEIATLAQKKGYWPSSERQRTLFPKWEYWTQEESKIRTAILLHVMTRLLDMDIKDPEPYICPSLDYIPLPCSRSLWLAKTASDWQSEYQKHLLLRKSVKILTVGDLRKSWMSNVEDLDVELKDELSTWSNRADDFSSVLLTSWQLP